MTVNDQATGTDSFSVVSNVVTPVPPTPIQPATPTKRRASGRVDFPGGVTVSPLGYRPLSGDHPIHVEGFGWMTVGIAQQYAASLAGAVAEVRAEEGREAAKEAGLRP